MIGERISHILQNPHERRAAVVWGSGVIGCVSMFGAGVALVYSGELEAGLMVAAVGSLSLATGAAVTANYVMDRVSDPLASATNDQQ